MGTELGKNQITYYVLRSIQLLAYFSFLYSAVYSRLSKKHNALILFKIFFPCAVLLDPLRFYLFQKKSRPVRRFFFQSGKKALEEQVSKCKSEGKIAVFIK